jgi:hypothetical protein
MKEYTIDKIKVSSYCAGSNLSLDVLDLRERVSALRDFIRECGETRVGMLEEQLAATTG